MSEISRNTQMFAKSLEFCTTFANSKTYFPSGISAKIAMILQHVATSVCSSKWQFDGAAVSKLNDEVSPPVPTMPVATFIAPAAVVPATTTNPAMIQPTTFNLPPELIQHIFLFSTAHELIQCIFSCHAWSVIICNPVHDQIIWEKQAK